MKAKTKYHDYEGTVVADTSDHFDFYQLLSERNVDLEIYEPIGARFFSSSIGGFSASIICEDKKLSNEEKRHIIQLNFKNELNKEEFFSMFKQFDVIITNNSEKYEKIEIDEIKTV